MLKYISNQSFNLPKSPIKLMGATFSLISEWMKFANQLPNYGGATYTRWGRKSCGAQATLVYSGQMTGPEYRSAGGGTNYQCLPNDPEYNPNAMSNVPYNKLRSAEYRADNLFGKSVQQHIIPCAVCEARRRVSQVMIPAKTRCPSSDWVLEYGGYLLSAAEHYGGDKFVDNAHYRSSYVCVDQDPESYTSKPATDVSGQLLYAVTVACSGDGALPNCPPYMPGGRALSCVVCSK